jgi:hypothetical protein
VSGVRRQSSTCTNESGESESRQGAPETTIRYCQLCVLSRTRGSTQVGSIYDLDCAIPRA